MKSTLKFIFAFALAFTASSSLSAHNGVAHGSEKAMPESVAAPTGIEIEYTAGNRCPAHPEQSEEECPSKCCHRGPLHTSSTKIDLRGTKVVYADIISPQPHKSPYFEIPHPPV